MNFKGKLVVDVTEGLFFSSAPGNARRPVEGMKYFKDRTPAQRAGFHINHLLESQWVDLGEQRRGHGFNPAGDLPGRKHRQFAP